MKQALSSNMSTKILNKKIALVDIAVLLFGFIDTFYIYVASSYFAEIINSSNVGFFYLISYISSLVLFFCLQPLMRILGRSRTLYLFLLLSLALVIFLTNSGPTYISGVVLLLFIVTSSVLWVLFDILLEGFSDDKRTGAIRGLNLTMMSLGVLLAPLLATATLRDFSYQGVFLAMLIFYVILFLFCLVAFRNVTGKHLPKIAFWRALFLVRKERALWQSYALSFTLYFFYSVMIIYMPLYLVGLGFSWTEIGSLFTIMLIPFILVQYPLGRLADKKYGEKEILIISLIIAVASTFVMAKITTPSFFLWAGILFLSRIGIAGLEVMKDTYFYRHIAPEEVDVISFFRTSLPLANIVVAALATSMLAFLPLASVFYLTAFILSLALIMSFTIVDSK